MSRKEVEFDEENGSDIEKHCNELGQIIENMVRANEKIAKELDRLFDKSVKRDTRINTILKNKEQNERV